MNIAPMTKEDIQPLVKEAGITVVPALAFSSFNPASMVTAVFMCVNTVAQRVLRNERTQVQFFPKKTPLKKAFSSMSVTAILVGAGYMFSKLIGLSGPQRLAVPMIHALAMLAVNTTPDWKEKVEKQIENRLPSLRELKNINYIQLGKDLAQTAMEKCTVKAVRVALAALGVASAMLIATGIVTHFNVSVYAYPMATLTSLVMTTAMKIAKFDRFSLPIQLALPVVGYTFYSILTFAVSEEEKGSRSSAFLGMSSALTLINRGFAKLAEKSAEGPSYVLGKGTPVLQETQTSSSAASSTSTSGSDRAPQRVPAPSTTGQGNADEDQQMESMVAASSSTASIPTVPAPSSSSSSSGSGSKSSQPAPLGAVAPSTPPPATPSPAAASSSEPGGAPQRVPTPSTSPQGNADEDQQMESMVAAVIAAMKEKNNSVEPEQAVAVPVVAQVLNHRKGSESASSHSDDGDDKELEEMD